jgi:hypothetical protein
MSKTRAPLSSPARIRFVGGPLHGRTGTTRNLPQHRDAEGHPVPYRRGVDLVTGARQLGGLPALYCLGRDQRTYEYLPALDTEVRTYRIKTLMERAARNPDMTHEIDKQIRAIEAGAVR